jgi:hypothetical protein
MISMKRIAAGIALALLWVLMCAVLFLPGCSSMQARPAATSLVVSYATMKYIEQAPLETRGARAARVIAMAELIQGAAGDAEMTIQALQGLALEKLPGDLAQSDRLLAMGLVNVVAQELLARVGHGGLESESLVRLSTLLEGVKQSAAFYLPPS